MVIDVLFVFSNLPVYTWWRFHQLERKKFYMELGKTYFAFRKYMQALIFLYTVEIKQQDTASLPYLQGTFSARSLSAKLFLHLSITQQVLLWLWTEFTVFLKVARLFLVHTNSESSTKKIDSKVFSISIVSDQPYMQPVFWAIAPVFKNLNINMF